MAGVGVLQYPFITNSVATGSVPEPKTGELSRCRAELSHIFGSVQQRFRSVPERFRTVQTVTVMIPFLFFIS